MMMMIIIIYNNTNTLIPGPEKIRHAPETMVEVGIYTFVGPSNRGLQYGDGMNIFGYFSGAIFVWAELL